ncbi:MAG: amidohydrolase [Phototrophicales bacterium]|nr:MAG: amidohydrolase [Phototrophicales bacterium]
MKPSFKTEAEAMRSQLVEWRRDLHQHPEIAFEEIRTARFVAETLAQFGFEVQTGIGKTGVVGILDGDDVGPTVMIRADMDALPIEEQNDTQYRSQIAQRMHACGHDAHTAIALAVAKMFAQKRSHWKGRLKFVFQPAEEIGQGAKAMIADGVLTQMRPDIVLGLHVWNDLPIGYVGITEGAAMAGTQRFSILITGKGGHAALPHQTHDPVVAAAQLMSAVQTIVSRNLDPLLSGVVSITQMQGSDAFNIIPAQVMLGGTIRAFETFTMDLIKTRLAQLAQQIALAFDCEATITYENSLNPLVNDPLVARRLRECFRQVDASLEIIDNIRTMGSEDMSEYLAVVPGVFFFVGSANAERGLNYPHHHPKFDIDEEALVIGASLLASAVAEYVWQQE